MLYHMVSYKYLSLVLYINSHFMISFTNKMIYIFKKFNMTIICDLVEYILIKWYMIYIIYF